MKVLQPFSLVITLLITLCISVNSQNVGIGTVSPTEKLEVSGIMYTNDGGVRFPDGTLQTTAAQSGNEVAASDTKLVGFLRINGITGPVDTLGLTGAFPVYKASQIISQPAGADFGDLEVVTEFGTSAVTIMQRVAQGTIIDFITLDLAEINSMGNPLIYQQIGMGNATLTMSEFNLEHKIGNEFSHLIRLTISAEFVGWQEQIGGNCFCWIKQFSISGTCSECFE